MNGARTFEDVLRDVVREVVRDELRTVLDDRARRNGLSDAGEDPGYLSIAKAAAFADVAPGTLRRWIRTGRLVARRAGRDHRVARGELERFLASGGVRADVSERARRILQRRLNGAGG
ncbi:MAG: helix-turn-helix domain-containing protein [Kofleriaceae bacterium]|nr:helix-turn-helix domain-containing protein [Kofleriaceae bacterium]MCL4224372.1 helix-turn-helix domain-containing protein [Myxococcales bacterium]